MYYVVSLFIFFGFFSLAPMERKAIPIPGVKEREAQIALCKEVGGTPSASLVDWHNQRKERLERSRDAILALKKEEGRRGRGFNPAALGAALAEDLTRSAPVKRRSSEARTPKPAPATYVPGGFFPEEVFGTAWSDDEGVEVLNESSTGNEETVHRLLTESGKTAGSDKDDVGLGIFGEWEE